MLIHHYPKSLWQECDIVKYLDAIIFRQEIDKNFKVKKRDRYIFELFAKLSLLNNTETIITYAVNALFSLKQTRTLIAILEKLSNEASRLITRNAIIGGLTQRSPYQTYLKNWLHKLILIKDALEKHIPITLQDANKGECKI